MLAGGISFGFIMRFHEFLPGLLEQIPAVGQWLKIVLALLVGFAVFVVTTSSLYHTLTRRTR